VTLVPYVDVVGEAVTVVVVVATATVSVTVPLEPAKLPLAG
jgi:hypothetical protein